MLAINKKITKGSAAFGKAEKFTCPSDHANTPRNLRGLESSSETALLRKACARRRGLGMPAVQDRKDHWGFFFGCFFFQSVMVSPFLRISVTGRNLEAFVC